MAGKSPVTVVTTVWKRLQRALLLESAAAKESHVKVGIIASKGGKASVGDGGLTLIELTAIHEFGSPAAGIPQRSFLRSTFARPEVHRDMVELCAKLTQQVIHGMPLERALGLLGAWSVARIRETIDQRLTKGPEPQENRPSTIKKKGSDLPLVDTGRLKQALAWKVWIGAARDALGRFTGGKVNL